MATPITWHNIQGASPAEGVRSLVAAQQGIGAAFDRFGEILKQRDEDTAKLNTQSFLNELSKFRTPEELAQAQASGLFDQLRSRYGVQMDQAVARQAEAQQMANLRNQVVAANTFADNTRTRNERGTVDAFQAAVANKDWAGAQGILDANELLGEGKLATSLRDAQNKDKEFGWKQNAEDRAAETHEQTTTLNGLKIDEANQKVKDEKQKKGATDLVSNFMLSWGQAVQNQQAKSEEATAAVQQLPGILANMGLNPAQSAELIKKHEHLLNLPGQAFGPEAIEKAAAKALADQAAAREEATNPDLQASPYASERLSRSLGVIGKYIDQKKFPDDFKEAADSVSKAINTPFTVKFDGIERTIYPNAKDIEAVLPQAIREYNGWGEEAVIDEANFKKLMAAHMASSDRAMQAGMAEMVRNRVNPPKSKDKPKTQSK